MIQILNSKVQIVAEVKTHSPFGFQSKKSWAELFVIADTIGDIISIHTDERWGGSLHLISKAKSLTTKPVLAKGIHRADEEIEQARKAGADYVLVVGRIPKPQYRPFCWIEPNTLKELGVIPVEMQVVWNSRDLKTGGLKKETFEQARILRKGWLCQASNIRSQDDIEPGADAVLIGSYLAEFAQSLS